VPFDKLHYGLSILNMADYGFSERRNKKKDKLKDKKKHPYKKGGRQRGVNFAKQKK
jgi:hypothetical protein